MSDGLDLASLDPDSDGCLCVVASFVSAARTVAEVTAEAGKRVMMSPLLSDFIEFRFVDLGPQPSQAGDLSVAVHRVADALLNPQSVAGHNYFAAVVVDRSAAVAGQVLGDCAASPFLAPLRMRLLGISNSDDRLGRRLGKDPAVVPKIVTSPAGVWTKKQDMVDVLRRFADELQHYFSAGHEPGLSIGELGELRARYHQHAAKQLADGAAGAGTSATEAAQSSGAGPRSGQEPDMLACDPPPAQAPEAQLPEGQQAQAPQATPGQPPSEAHRFTRDQQQSQPASQETHEDAPAAGPPPSGSAEAAQSASQPASRGRRWLSDLRRQRGRRPAADSEEDTGGETKPKTEGLIYLLIVGDESCRDEAALNRNRSALLEVDKKIAELPGFAYRVRMLHGDEDGLRGDLREAGQLGRRDVRRTVASVDFAAVIESIRTSLRRDRVQLKAAGVTARPAVVLFTPEPPLADTVAAELFHELARDASITWALSKSARALLSEAFTDVPGVQVIVDDQGIADEIAASLASDADRVRADA
jgi:hypothetical protein